MWKPPSNYPRTLNTELKSILTYLKPVLNAYAVLFFSQNTVFGLLLLIVSFQNYTAGLCALASVIFSLLAAYAFGFEKHSVKMGLYSFNNLLLGLAFGTFYHVNTQFFLWFAVTSLITLIITCVMMERLGRIGLPILSLPFIITFWLILSAANSVFNTGLLQQSSSMLQELYNGRNNLSGWHQYLCDHMPWWLCLYFRALSAVLFQSNTVTGLTITLGLFLHSRIAFSLSVIGFASAILFNFAFNIYPDGISYYHLGANFMMATVAIGSFFLIPSWRSYLCGIISIPVCFVLVNAFSALLGVYFLPVFSLPFCIVNITFLYFLLVRKYKGKLRLTVFQHYSPERNLYQFANQQARLKELKYFNFKLPFMGRWTVSQGYEGSITHLGQWAQALDFVLTDDDNKTYQHPGTVPEHFYAYNKPVLACGDGVVVTVIDHVMDNPIGEINTTENWGNTVVIKHLDGLYSKVSHLKKGSVVVKAGQYVNTGDKLGLCGNSGRSPEPHLHFQVQATPYVGSKTLAYPFAAYEMVDDEGVLHFETAAIPKEGCHISNFLPDTSIKKAFDFQPGYVAKMKSADRTETIESVTDGFHQNYLYSHETGAVAYFINNGSRFYFTSFYGDKNSLLYQFYLTAFNVLFRENKSITDDFPVQDTSRRPVKWLQDLIAPFHIFLKPVHYSYASSRGGELQIISERLEKGKSVGKAIVYLKGQVINRFENINTNTKISVEWLAENI